MAFLCGCEPWSGRICSAHCQWQGCTDGRHTEACIRGERIKQGERTLTTDDCERIFHAALAAGDTRGVEAALQLLAVRDPHRAKTLLDTTRVALAIALNKEDGK